MNAAAILLVQMARDSGRAVVTEFDLFLFARQLFRDRGYRGATIPPRNGPLDARRARKLLSEATFDLGCYPGDVPSHYLPRDPDFTSVLFTVGGGDATKVMLEADPFCYLSHASALAFHGIVTDTSDLHISTPMRGQWAGHARHYMAEMLGGYPASANDENEPLFPLTQAKPCAKVRGRLLHRHELSNPLPSTSFDQERTRVSPPGVTFRDTLAAPNWCGGMDRVVTIWRTDAARHADAIITAVAESPEKIVRVRAGYLLEEVLGIRDPRIAAWLADAQRGSSRKLDPTAPYIGRFSTRWMLSINVETPDLPATTAD
jgi:predicted transcriptional regulator of viral defense system